MIVVLAPVSHKSTQYVMFYIDFNQIIRYIYLWLFVCDIVIYMHNLSIIESLPPKMCFIIMLVT